jgi:ABC-type multidrug transport system permease subunit
VTQFLSVARAVGWRNVHNYFTNPAMVVPGLLFPLFFFTAFAGGLSRVDQVPGFGFPSGYTAWVYGFVLLQASAFGGVFTGFAIARDFESGFARRIMLAAANRPGIVAGYWLAGIARAAFTIAVVTAVALVAGMEVGGGGLDLVALYVLALLVNMAALLFSCGVAMRLRTMQAGPAMQVPVFLLLFIAPVWVPLDLLTGWVEAVATVNPVTLLLDADRSLIAGEPHKVGIAFAVIAGIAAALVLWARGGLRSAERAAG